MPTTKTALREWIREQRAALTTEAITARSRAAIAHLQTCPLLQGARHLACFMALPQEVQTQGFVARCIAEGRRVCVPCQAADGPGYDWGWITAATRWRFGALGIAEPDYIDPVEDIRCLDLAIVPALAVDPAGNRLGHGGGHYDRLLSGFTGPRIGLILNFQRVQAVPALAHDIPLTAVVTEAGYFPAESSFSKQEKLKTSASRKRRTVKE